MIMKLTKREKKLLIALGCIILCYGYINLLLLPQFIKFNELKASISNHESIIDEDIYSSDLLDKLNSTYEKNREKVESYSGVFFTSLEQSKLILLLDDLIAQTELEINSINFSEYKEEELAGAVVNKISASIPFNGSYDALVQFLKGVRKNEEKIIIKDINILNDAENSISGSLVLDFYSVPPLGTRKVSDGVINGEFSFKQNPFKHFEGYIDEFINNQNDANLIYNNNDKIDLSVSRPSIDDTKEDIKKELLYNFEELDMFFVGNPKDIEASINMDSNKKQGSYAVKVQYDFLRQRKTNIANFVFDNIKPSISMQPEFISLMVYSYEKSDHKIVLVLKDSQGEEYNILLSDEISWTEWNTLQADLPETVTYPAEVQRIYVQNNTIESKTNGIFLLDNMEVAYRNTLHHNYKEKDNITDSNKIEVEQTPLN